MKAKVRFASLSSPRVLDPNDVFQSNRVTSSRQVTTLFRCGEGNERKRHFESDNRTDSITLAS